MSSGQTTRDPAITEAMLPVIDRFMHSVYRNFDLSPARMEEWNQFVRSTIAQCLAIAERERAERTEASSGNPLA